MVYVSFKIPFFLRDKTIHWKIYIVIHGRGTLFHIQSRRSLLVGLPSLMRQLLKYKLRYQDTLYIHPNQNVSLFSLSFENYENYGRFFLSITQGTKRDR